MTWITHVVSQLITNPARGDALCVLLLEPEKYVPYERIDASFNAIVFVIYS